MSAIRGVVSGRVQGVGFRVFAVEQARRLGVNGQVWNQADGSVAFIASHASRERLSEFLASLETGPGEVEKIESQPSEEFKGGDFRIVRR